MLNIRVLGVFVAISNVKIGIGQRTTGDRDSNEIQIELIEGKSLQELCKQQKF